MAARRGLWVGLVLLGALLGVLGARAQAAPQPGFQQDKFLGRWFTAGLASNSTWFREKKAKLSMCTSDVALTEDGSLNMTTTFLRKGQCETRSVELRPSSPPGAYVFTSPYKGSTLEMVVAETDYARYALLYSQGSPGSGLDFRMATLYSRSQSPEEALKATFSSFAAARGFTEDCIVFLPGPAQCLEKPQ